MAPIVVVLVLSLVAEASASLVVGLPFGAGFWRFLRNIYNFSSLTFASRVL